MTKAAKVLLHIVVYVLCLVSALWIARESDMWALDSQGFAQFAITLVFLIGFWTYPIVAFVNVVFRRWYRN